jgi:sec-independent protein translocase protein TatA
LEFLFLNLGAGEILVIALFVLMFFGSRQIPELMRGLGRATREFKDAVGGIEREVRGAANFNVMDDEERKPVEGTQQKNATTASDGMTEEPPGGGKVEGGS